MKKPLHLRSAAAAATDAPATPKPVPQTTSGLGACLAVFLAALVVRTVYVLELRHSPLFAVLMGDASEYDRWAQDIAGGNWFGDQVFYQAPFYPYSLAAVFKLFGHHLMLVRALQIVIGSATCMLVALAGRRFVSPRAGVLAGVFLALYPPAIFFDALIQKAVLDLFFMGLLLFLLARQLDKPRRPSLLAAGITLGCFGLTRENALVLFAVIVVWLLAHPFKQVMQSRLARVGIFTLGVALVLVPVGLRNRIVGGDFLITTAQMGPNFFIGNSPKANGQYIPLLTGRASAEFERADAATLAEAETGRNLTPAEVSRFWLNKGLDFIRSEPGRWLLLMARKWALLWNSKELIDTEGIEVYQDHSRLLGVLNRLLHFGVLCPLAVVGLAATWRERRRLWPLYFVILGIAGSITLFYVFARYRYPLVAVLVIFAAAGLQHVAALLRDRRTRAILSYGMAITLTAVATNWPITLQGNARLTTLTNLAEALAKTGRIDDAAAYCRQALQIAPDDARSNLRMAEILVKQAKPQEAESFFAKAQQSSPEYHEAYSSRADALRGQGKLQEAVELYRQALRLMPNDSKTHYNLGLALMDAGALDQAKTHFEQAVRFQPDFAEAHSNLGSVLWRKGLPDQAAASFREALRLKPDLGPATENLGGVCLDLGRFAEAIQCYAAMVARRPNDPAAHHLLGNALMAAGKVPDAIGSYRRALQLDPNLPGTLGVLAWVLATNPSDSLRNGAEAVALAERACALTNQQSPQYLDALAAAYAETGRFADALATLRKAMELAASAGHSGLADLLSSRQKFYETNTPYRETRP